MKLFDILSKDAIDRLKATVREKHSFEASQVKIVGLDDIRRMAGAAWPEIADRVRTKSMYFLERRLGEGDVIVPAGDGFLIIYGDSAGDQASAKAAAMQEALNEFYLGEDGMASLRAKVEPRIIQAAALAAMLDVGAPVPAPKVEQDLAFMPVWSVAHETITGYWPVPIRRAGAATRYGYDSAWDETGAHEDGVDFLATDLQMLAHALAGIQQSLNTGRRCLVGYSVHATTMQHKDRRQAFLQQLRAAPETARPYLLGRIAEVEPGTPAMTIADWAHQLRRVSLRVTLELHHTERAFTWLDGVGAFSVSCVLPAKPSTDNERPHYSGFLQKWSTGLKRQGLKFRLDNIASSQLMAQALEGGVDFCSSAFFWPPISAPNGMKPYSLAQLRRELGLPAAR